MSGSPNSQSPPSDRHRRWAVEERKVTAKKTMASYWGATFLTDYEQLISPYEDVLARDFFIGLASLSKDYSWDKIKPVLLTEADWEAAKGGGRPWTRGSITNVKAHLQGTPGANKENAPLKAGVADDVAGEEIEVAGDGSEEEEEEVAEDEPDKAEHTNAPLDRPPASTARSLQSSVNSTPRRIRPTLVSTINGSPVAQGTPKNKRGRQDSPDEEPKRAPKRARGNIKTYGRRASTPAANKGGEAGRRSGIAVDIESGGRRKITEVDDSEDDREYQEDDEEEDDEEDEEDAEGEEEDAGPIENGEHNDIYSIPLSPPKKVAAAASASGKMGDAATAPKANNTKTPRPSTPPTSVAQGAASSPAPANPKAADGLGAADKQSLSDGPSAPSRLSRPAVRKPLFAAPVAKPGPRLIPKKPAPKAKSTEPTKSTAKPEPRFIVARPPRVSAVAEEGESMLADPVTPKTAATKTTVAETKAAETKTAEKETAETPATEAKMAKVGVAQARVAKTSAKTTPATTETPKTTSAATDRPQKEPEKSSPTPSKTTAAKTNTAATKTVKLNSATIETPQKETKMIPPAPKTTATKTNSAAAKTDSTAAKTPQNTTEKSWSRSEETPPSDALPSCLRPGQWLTDDVVHKCLQFFASCRPVSFVAIDPVSAACPDDAFWERLHAVLADFTTILVPLHVDGNHWTLASVSRGPPTRNQRDAPDDTTRLNIRLYDSLPDNVEAVRRAETLAQSFTLDLICHAKTNSPWAPAANANSNSSQPSNSDDRDDLVLVGETDASGDGGHDISCRVTPVKCPRQTNGSDCGVAVLAYAAHIVAFGETPDTLDFALWRDVVGLVYRSTTPAVLLPKPSSPTADKAQYPVLRMVHNLCNAATSTPIHQFEDPLDGAPFPTDPATGHVPPDHFLSTFLAMKATLQRSYQESRQEVRRFSSTRAATTKAVDSVVDLFQHLAEERDRPRTLPSSVPSSVFSPSAGAGPSASTVRNRRRSSLSAEQTEAQHVEIAHHRIERMLDMASQDDLVFSTVSSSIYLWHSVFSARHTSVVQAAQGLEWIHAALEHNQQAAHSQANDSARIQKRIREALAHSS